MAGQGKGRGRDKSAASGAAAADAAGKSQNAGKVAESNRLVDPQAMLKTLKTLTEQQLPDPRWNACERACVCA